MRGRPLLEWLVFLCVWALLLIPLWHVTGGQRERHTEKKAIATEAGAGRVSAWVRLTFSEPPVRATMFSGGGAVWSNEEAADAELEQLVELTWGDGGPDLRLEAEWTASGHRASEITVDPVGGRGRKRITLWSNEKKLRQKVVFE